MTLPEGYLPLGGSAHPHPSDKRLVRAADTSEEITFTVLLKRRQGAATREPEQIATPTDQAVSREAFALSRGADPAGIQQVVDFAKAHGLDVLDTDAAARTIELRGKIGDVNQAFATTLNYYSTASGHYRSHDGGLGVPKTLEPYVAGVVGLTDRKVLATHFSTAKRRKNTLDPPNTRPLTPQQVAALYDFPAGDGEGQVIGLYEMETNEGPAGYDPHDIQLSLQGFGLGVPKIVDVAVDGVGNSGFSDGETGLDITVASAVAPKATIAVYFAGPQPQNIIHALAQMIHPKAGAPEPSIVSISYGWGPDDPGSASFSDGEYAQISSLFEDAATKHITVLVSSGDTGAYVEDARQAQVSYPASDIWVTACGGTSVGSGANGGLIEYVWNDVGAAGPGATGGGVSLRFSPPGYQDAANLPKHIVTGAAGRGVPDIAGNASENSGYDQVINGAQPQPVGGTSAVAPLYAGLIARINANLAQPAGFLNPLLYAGGAGLFRNIAGPPGPANNSYGHVQGYPATSGWNGCTGLGVLDGEALQALLNARTAAAAAQPAPSAPAPAAHS